MSGSTNLRQKKGKRAVDPARLAPPEEKMAESIPTRVDGPKIKISQDLMTEAENTGSLFRLDPIVLAILLAAVGWVLFIAWETYQTP